MAFSRLGLISMAFVALALTSQICSSDASIVPMQAWNQRAILPWETNLKDEAARADKRRIKHMIARVMKKDQVNQDLAGQYYTNSYSQDSVRDLDNLMAELNYAAHLDRLN